MLYNYLITYENNSGYTIIWLVTFRKRSSDLVNIQCLLFVRDCVSVLFAMSLAIRMLHVIDLLNGWMNKSCCLLVFGCDVWRTYLSQKLWHIQRNWGPGSSAHRPIGTAPSGGPGAHQVPYITPVHVCLSYGIHPNSPWPVQILSSCKAPITSHFLY